MLANITRVLVTQRYAWSPVTVRKGPCPIIFDPYPSPGILSIVDALMYHWDRQAFLFHSPLSPPIVFYSLYHRRPASLQKRDIYSMGIHLTAEEREQWARYRHYGRLIACIRA